MRLAVFANGTHGDVEPHVALAAGLRAAGHHVRFCTHPIFRKLVEDHDLEFFGQGGVDPRTVMRQVQAATVKRHWFGRLHSYFFRRQPPDAGMLQEIVTACEGSDVVLSSVGTVFHVAEMLNRPLVQTALYPVHPTGEFPHYLSRLRVSLGPGANRLSHELIRQLFWQVDRRWVNRWRRDSLKLPPTSFWGPFRALDRRQVPCWYGFSEYVIPRPRDWGNRIEVTGFWFLEESTSWQPGTELKHFLESGPAPVGIGFGSLVDPDPEELRRMIFGALAQVNRRAIVLSGWKSAEAGCVPENVFVADWVPFRWLLPRLHALVHHAGAGTMAAALQAGLPSVAVPYSGEQAFWASRLHSLGACAPPVPRRQLTEARLAQALYRACSDQAIRARAQESQRRLRSENGVANAVAHFNRLSRQLVRPPRDSR